MFKATSKLRDFTIHLTLSTCILDGTSNIGMDTWRYFILDQENKKYFILFQISFSWSPVQTLTINIVNYV